MFLFERDSFFSQLSRLLVNGIDVEKCLRNLLVETTMMNLIWLLQNLLCNPKHLFLYQVHPKNSGYSEVLVLADYDLESNRTKHVWMKIKLVNNSKLQDIMF